MVQVGLRLCGPPCPAAIMVGMWLSWLEHRTVTPLTQVRFPCAARAFSPRVNFQCRLSYDVRTPPCAIACINICAHVKDPVVYVRVRWITETLKHPACTVGWVARLCRSWLSPGKSNPNFQWVKSHWDNTVVESRTHGSCFHWIISAAH